jgi:hypothetical protein
MDSVGKPGFSDLEEVSFFVGFLCGFAPLHE